MYINRIFELSMVLDSEQFQEVFEPIQDIYWDENREEYFDQSLEEKGILVIYRNSQYKKKIRLIVNPAIVEENTKNIEKFIHKLEKRISGYFHSAYGLNDFTVSKMQLTSDIDVGNPESTLAYLKALHRVGKVKGFSPTEYDSFDDDISFCLEGNSNGIDFLVYDLRSSAISQSENAEMKPKQFKSMIENTKGILRVEVRLTKAKAIRAYTDEYLASDQIAERSGQCPDIFMDTFARIIPYGDFYKKGRAAEIIREEVKNSVMRRKMLHLLALIPEKRSLLLAQKASNCRQNDEVMMAFAKINLSPVTLSKRFDGKHLKNLYTYLEI